MKLQTELQTKPATKLESLQRARQPVRQAVASTASTADIAAIAAIASTADSAPRLRPGPAHPRRTARPLALLAVLASSLLLSGCDGETQELQAWMDQQRRDVRPQELPLAAPKKFDPVPYANGQQIDPFSNQKLSVAIKQESRQPNSVLAAELDRRKEPLESFALENMAMVGSVNKAGRPIALLRVESLLYQVKPGDYLGMNYGRVMRISETEVTLREIVQDSAGEWTERPASLQLQERGQDRGQEKAR